MGEPPDPDDLVVDGHEQPLGRLLPQPGDRLLDELGKSARDPLGAHRPPQVLGARLAEENGTAPPLERRGLSDADSSSAIAGGGRVRQPLDRLAQRRLGGEPVVSTGATGPAAARHPQPVRAPRAVPTSANSLSGGRLPPGRRA